jgi:hypothetical protein
MNKEILKRNIEQVIMQPCNAKYPERVVPNGLSEDAKYIMVKIRPDDSSWQCNLVDRDGNPIDYIERILERIPEKYRGHLVTLKHDENWIHYAYKPVFDTDTQEMWDNELDTFYKAKQEWCDKYGCD